MGTGAPLLALALAALLVLPGWRDAARRGWLVAFLATLTLCIALLALPPLLPGGRLIGARWNWGGGLLALGGLVWIASLLARRAGLSWAAMGFTWRQRPGAWRAALGVSALALSLNVLVLNRSDFRQPGVPLETWLYQATLPGLMEELLFRGVLLALLDRAFPARRRMWGVSVGWGGLVVTLVFVALHGWSAGTLLGVLPAALLYLWLRLHTGSLLAPVLVHNLWNLSVYVAHL
jgi:membrane protease YdiL (CAAX protease family)